MTHFFFFFHDEKKTPTFFFFPFMMNALIIRVRFFFPFITPGSSSFNLIKFYSSRYLKIFFCVTNFFLSFNNYFNINYIYNIILIIILIYHHHSSLEFRPKKFGIYLFYHAVSFKKSKKSCYILDSSRKS